MIIKEYRTNFSKFLNRKNAFKRLGIPNSVKVIIDEDVLDCSGPILAQHSPVLLDLMLTKKDEIFLDNFKGCSEEVFDCLDFLYGADVEVNLKNIHTFVKFAFIYKVQGMLEMCLNWIKVNLDKDNFAVLLKVGFFVHRLNNDCYIINLCTDLCLSFLTSKVPAFSKLPEIIGLTNEVDALDTVLFLLKKELVQASQSSLPLLFPWIDSADKTAVLLEHIDNQNMYTMLAQTLKDTVLPFVDRLEAFADNISASKLLTKLQRSMLSTMALKTAPNLIAKYDFNMILQPSKRWLQFDENQILSLPDVFALEGFQYGELVVDWLKERQPGQAIVNQLWSKFSQITLSFEYVEILRNTIMDVTYNAPNELYQSITNQEVSDETSVLNDGTTVISNFHIPDDVCEHILNNNTTRYQIPEVTDLGNAYKYKGLSLLSNKYCDFIKNSLLTFSNVSILNNCKVIGCEKTTQHERLFALTDNSPCYNLNLPTDDDRVTHHHHDLVKHWYFTRLKEGKRVLYSLVTNSEAEVMAMLRGRTKEEQLMCHCLEVREKFKEFGMI